MTAREGQGARFWSREGAMVHCGLCPHRCRIAEGKAGLCKARINREGVMTLPYFGRLSALADDPIEKKPLHHFLPGSRVLSAGYFGCNMRCPFCQNWPISQEMDPDASFVPPAELVAAARNGGFPSVAYTYSEPTIHFEYTLEAMRLARASGIRNVLVTNGCILEEPAKELLSLTDAANVDLKSWSADIYRSRLGGELETVKAFIGLAASRCHLELTTLVVPGVSDDEEGMEGIARFIQGISPNIPLHLSAYHPAFQEKAPPTTTRVLELLARIAENRLNYVYIGNVEGGRSDSLCPGCRALLIRRHGYSVETIGLAALGNGAGGQPPGAARCAKCGLSLPFLLDANPAEKSN